MTLQIKGFWLEDGQKLDRRFSLSPQGGFQTLSDFSPGRKRSNALDPVMPEVGEMLGELKNC